MSSPDRHGLDREEIERLSARNQHYGTSRASVERERGIIERAKRWSPPPLETGDYVNGEVQLEPGRIVDYLPGERDERGFADEAYQSLLRSIAAEGQHRPIVVRPSKMAAFQFDLVCGRRRLDVCRALGLQVRAYVEQMDDTALLAAMVQDNQQRAGISLWERGRWVAQLSRQHDYSLRQLGEIIGISHEMVRQLRLIGSLPEALIRLLKDPRRLTRREGQQLAELVADLRPSGGDLARVASRWTNRLERASVSIQVSALIRLLQEGKVPDPSPDKRHATIVMGLGGRTLARIVRQQPGLPSLVLAPDLSHDEAERIMQVIDQTLRQLDLAQPPRENNTKNAGQPG